MENNMNNELKLEVWKSCANKIDINKLLKIFDKYDYVTLNNVLLDLIYDGKIEQESTGCYKSIGVIPGNITQGKTKATFHLSDEAIDILNEVWMKSIKNKNRITKTKIVEDLIMSLKKKK